MRRASIAAVLLASSAGGAAFGQGFEGSTITATVSERFEANDNYDLDDPSPGTSYFADTRLTLGFLNQTPTQNFELGFSTGLRALWQAEQPFEFTLASPTGASLDYDNAWADGLFDMSFDYRQRQVDYTEAISADDDPNQLPDDLSQLQNNTREMRYDANIGVAFGTSTPSSYELRFIGSQVDYTDVTPDQVPRSTLEGQAAWNLQFNPILASRVTGDYLYYNADNSDQTELRRASVGAGVVYTPDVNTSLGLGVNYADRQRKDLVNDALETTESNNGPGITGEFSYTTEELVFSGEGEWSSAAPTTRLSGTVRAVYTLPRGRVIGRVFQNYTGTSGGSDEARVTGLGIGLTRELTSVSSIGFDFRYATQVDVDDGPGPLDPDINRTDFTATYSHAITSTIDADIGYSYRTRSEEPTDASSNAVFVQIGKSFETRP
ncbi:hypothetical protein [uncultured Amaricoccus sp.]|uniref:hypothetical protein n=1 Tax=uncultured Amaricoccus sp. TaxID=339341 RepID=UPI00262CE1C6|nr:hypothetical protein [uncultured Amaricoccus sp.]